ncbi:sulfur reduction protein DsrE [uncultured Desulfobulbus sp.]|uniref:sulfur reduction protein DsrE n=1 Tax=uncultured Desulfobulbus sp. TaxID=239745 RepID=UPI0029C6CAC4|nr:sulfur reduction protein DsrE [uncultured Desulfobulbus sp.]
MKTALMVCSGDAEVVWNAFRMGNLMLEQMDDVTMFLNGPSVRYASLTSASFPLTELAKLFTLSEGVLLA